MAIAALGLVPQTAAGEQANRITGVGVEDFLRILLTQLNFQDPLKPIDNQEFIAQLAQFTNLEQTRQLSDKIDSLLTIQAANQSVGLIGKTVEIAGTNATSVGTVTTIDFRQGEPLLTVRLANNSFLTDVRLSSITLVR